MTANSRQRVLLHTAQRLATQGIAVFPLGFGDGIPIHLLDWPDHATADPTQIQKWWSTSACGIGIALGRRSGLVMISTRVASRVGYSHGTQELAALATAADATLPETWTVSGPAGCHHRFFTVGDGIQVRGSHSHLGNYVDVYGEGDYAVAGGTPVAGSIFTTVVQTPPQPLPGWLVPLLQRAPERGFAPVLGEDARSVPDRIRVRLKDDASEIARVNSRDLHGTLWRCAGRIGRYVAEQTLPEDVARHVLNSACRHRINAGQIQRSLVEATVTNAFDHQRHAAKACPASRVQPSAAPQR